MITGPKYKICRRLGSNIFEKCANPKFASREPLRRGRPKAKSEFGIQMIEKQKVRFTYGLRERQFANYVKEASEKMGVNPAERLYQNLETRLDNIVYRLGIAHTRAFARQMVSHGHITVNGRKVTIPSFAVRVGDVVAVRPESREKTLFRELVQKMEERGGTQTPEWLSVDPAKLSGTIAGLPVMDTASGFNITSVMEFYSR